MYDGLKKIANARYEGKKTMIISYVSTSMDQEDFGRLFTGEKKMPGQQGPKFNRLIMEGLVANGAEVHACTGRPVTNGNCSRWFLPAMTHVKNDKFVYRYGSVLNLPILKNIWKMVGTYLTIRREIRNGTSAVICDVLNASIALGASTAAKHKKIPCVGIVTDLPELMVTGVDQRHVKMVNSILDQCTGYVFLTEAMNEKLNQSNKPYVVMEGLCDEDMSRVEKKKAENRTVRKCIYAGLLDARYGVQMMVEGFLRADLSDVELDLYGDGPYAEALTKIAKENHNIIYHGTVLNDVVIQAEREADLLINPRPTREAFTKYSFPSKNMEYMATGTPVLTTSLPGMPEEYKRYVYLIMDETVEGVSKALQDYFNRAPEETERLGLEARNFVLKNKNNRVQAQKIMELLCR